MASSNNDINVLNMSPFTHHVAKDDIHFVINYMNLFPGIICLLIASRSEVVFFMQTIHDPHDEKCQHFIMMQKTFQKSCQMSFWCLSNFMGYYIKPL
jgi:hypothetical protein